MAKVECSIQYISKTHSQIMFSSAGEDENCVLMDVYKNLIKFMPNMPLSPENLTLLKCIEISQASNFTSLLIIFNQMVQPLGVQFKVQTFFVSTIGTYRYSLFHFLEGKKHLIHTSHTNSKINCLQSILNYVMRYAVRVIGKECLNYVNISTQEEFDKEFVKISDVCNCVFMYTLDENKTSVPTIAGTNIPITTQRMEKKQDLDHTAQSSEKKQQSPDLSVVIHTLKQTIISIQSGAFHQGNALNQLAKSIDPNFEPVIIGQQHRAAGCLPYVVHNKQILVLGGMVKKSNDKFAQYVVNGGKGQGTERPPQTALRELEEETLGVFGKDFQKYFYSRPQLSLEIVDGKYTLYLVDVGNMQITDNKVSATPESDEKRDIDLDSYLQAYSKQFSSNPESSHLCARGAIPEVMIWLPFKDQSFMYSGVAINDFARTILSQPAILGFFRDLQEKCK